MNSIQPSGFMEESVPYSSMKEVNIVISSTSVTYWDPLAGNPPLTGGPTSIGHNGHHQHHYLLRIVLAEGCLLLQVRLK